MDQTEGLKRVDNHVKMCSECEVRPAITMIWRRLVKAHRHDLCKKCWRDGNNSRRNGRETNGYIPDAQANQENIRETLEAIIWERYLSTPQQHD